MNPTPRASSPRLSKAGQGFVSPKSPIPPAASSPTPWKSIAPPTASSPPVSHQESFKPSTATPTATPATPATLPLVGRLMQGILAKKKVEEARKAAADRLSSTSGVLGWPEADDNASQPCSSLAPAAVASRRSQPPPPPSSPTPARAKASALLQVLPPWPVRTSSAMDTSLSTAVAALERQEYDFASAAFKSCILQWRESGISVSAAAVRPRVQAAVNYTKLCQLLKKIQVQKEGLAKAYGGSLAVKRELCQSWECVLRLPKAPCHTIHFLIHAMESLFDFAHGAGGWAAANRLAQVLLQRHESYLNGAEQQKAQHILTTTQHGCLSGRVGTEIASACPACGAPADFLALSCDSCHAVFGVDFRDLTVCDLRQAKTCTVCRATFGSAKLEQPERRRQAGLAQPIKSSLCPACTVGELHQPDSAASV